MNETILQLHHQKHDDPSCADFISQCGFDFSDHDEAWRNIREWFHGVQERHPVPDGYIWMICDQRSEHFMMAAV